MTEAQGHPLSVDPLIPLPSFVKVSKIRSLFGEGAMPEDNRLFFLLKAFMMDVLSTCTTLSASIASPTSMKSRQEVRINIEEEGRTRNVLKLTVRRHEAQPHVH